MIICENAEFKEAAEFYADKLGIQNDTIIAIVLHNNLEDVLGYCEYHDEDVLPYYLVGVDRRIEPGLDNPMEVLAHELVHVKQYSSGELVDQGNSCLWYNKEYAEVVTGSDEYYLSPWEVEAFGKQVGLYRMYLREFF